MSKFLWFFFLLSLHAQLAQAESYNLPLQLDYSLINKIISNQLFADGNHSAKLWQDTQGCSSLSLADLKVNGKQGQLELQNNVHAELGAKLGGHCMAILKWNGLLHTLQQPTLTADGKSLSLPVTSATAFDQQGRQVNIGQLQQLLDDVIKTKLATLTIDLTKSQADIRRSLATYLPEAAMVDVNKALATLRFDQVQANDDNIAVTLNFTAPKPDSSPSPVFSAEEQQQWDGIRQQWDGIFANAIDKLATDAGSQELRDTLTEILLDSRRTFQIAVSQQDDHREDPVRAFFVNSWERLAPHLRNAAKQLPELQSLKYLTFIAATDVVYQLETLGAPFGLSLTADGIRKLARTLIAGKQEQAHSN